MDHTFFDLEFSPHVKLYALYRENHSTRYFVQNLSTLYPRALVKAIGLAKGQTVCNWVPMSHRVMSGICLHAGNAYKQGLQLTCLPFGKYKGKSVKHVSKSDRGYLVWFFNNVHAESDEPDDKFREQVIEIKAWIIWYLPELASNVEGGPLFSAYHYTSPQAATIKPSQGEPSNRSRRQPLYRATSLATRR